ncbi:hypothetical protein L6164_011888 [Bauhinia variegata]|uniref:Uncharacterized protein n=1 Tax=Bauhinia variegata TaxID=167791 RepID=A0ACB9PCM1_BAUVA|nr:hypothetical protein L6164_011888 [Bauhinia variegata]
MNLKTAIVITSYPPASIRHRPSKTSASATGGATPVALILKQETPKSISLPSTQSLVSASPPIVMAKGRGFRPSPELGLLYLSFVLSMAVCAIFSMAVISIPTMIAFGRLAASTKKLAEVVSKEVPGTMFSLKLSSMELKELTQQLSDLRQQNAGVRGGNKDRSSNKTSTAPKKNPVS